ncbi:MAG: 50S ribosomal protein L28 [Clostridium sp.]|nr:50S ribosomal protein L28 [Clostridium sp.]MCM1444243.1 50S ribosomal protein L28 [Candidatus Amulumruptor caecigallinarius]
MAKKVTSRKPLKGNKRSHACNATKHTQNLNLQKVKLTNGKSVRISTRELKTAKKTSNVEA